MKAIQFNATIPRYAAGLALGRVSPSFLWSGLSCTSLVEVPEPELPGEDWVLVRTRYGGICGSDISTIYLHTSPYYSPLSSFPTTIGHENVGYVARAGSQAGEWQAGERVVVEPLLWCAPRGFEELCPNCAKGQINRCLRQAEGSIAPGVLIGACKDTGGSWSEYFVAHKSQLYRVPNGISDENALMVEPFAVGLHAVLQNLPKPGETVLVLGAGSIGLCVMAALRALGVENEVIVLARYPFQAEAARRLGASRIISAGRGQDYFSQLAELTGAKLLQPLIGKRVVVGGVDRIFECVGSDSSLDDALRLARPGGTVVVVGVPGIAKGVDWTAIFSQELDVRAVFAYNHAEPFEGQEHNAFEMILDLMAKDGLDLSWMLTHRFTLAEYGKALNLPNTRRSAQVIKGVFEFPPG